MKEFILSLLDTNNDMPENRKSVIAISLRTARHLCGNDLVDGNYNYGDLRDDIFDNKLYYSYISGIAQYLIVLEQMGCIFSFSGNPKENKIKQILKYSELLNKEEINALVSLRHALLHNFSLATKASKNNHHRFTLHNDCEKENIRKVVELPSKEWNGDYNNSNDQYNTIINIHSFTLLVENIIKKVKEDYNKDKLELAITDRNELNARFTII